MFRRAKAPSPRAVGATGTLDPLALPYKGINPRAPLSQMPPEYGIALRNVSVEPNGLRTRKGYVERSTGIGATNNPVSTIMYYLPAVAAGTKLFAAKDGSVFDVTVSGSGPYVAMAGIAGSTDYWNGTMLQNSAGSFLCVCNEGGGYSYFNGVAWTTPTFGGGAGQISGCDPAKFVYCISFKKRLWFVEKDSTSAWYLPVDQITGAATEFDFGSQFSAGGLLTALADWTLDGGNGIDDQLVVASSMGNVVIYKGVDPASATDWNLVGTWYAAPLPTGRRQLLSTGGEVYILTQVGMSPISKLISSTALPALAKEHISFNIDPVLAELMRGYSQYAGWQILSIDSEESILVTVPAEVTGTYAGSIFNYKVTTESWSILDALPYRHVINTGSGSYAGTSDGRVVSSFSGPLDAVLLDGTNGVPVICRVIPAYQTVGKSRGYQTQVKMVRPTFLCDTEPALKVTVLTDFGPEQFQIAPTLTFASTGSLWGTAIWGTSLWGAEQRNIHKWYGASGEGFVVTTQLDYQALGGTVLTSIDLWDEKGRGVL